eukprot:2234176-Alexandrium_andersonii.AAC.1
METTASGRSGTFAPRRSTSVKSRRAFAQLPSGALGAHCRRSERPAGLTKGCARARARPAAAGRLPTAARR